MKLVPILNLGDLSDTEAKGITIKANTLRGEFNSVKLAGMVDDMTKAYGKEQVINDLPYTPERIQSMVDLLHTNTDEPAGCLRMPAVRKGPYRRVAALTLPDDPNVANAVRV